MKKEKAQELIQNFSFKCKECDYDLNAKQSALIAVNEIILELDYLFEMIGDPCINSSWEYWQNVKQELEKL